MSCSTQAGVRISNGNGETDLFQYHDVEPSEFERACEAGLRGFISPNACQQSIFRERFLAEIQVRGGELSPPFFSPFFLFLFRRDTVRNDIVAVVVVVFVKSL